MEKIRVLVVDDHLLFRRGVVSSLAEYEDLQVVGEGKNGAEAVQMAGTLAPNVIVMDLRMPVLDGVGAIQKLQASAVNVNVLVLTVSEQEEDLFAAMKGGAKGYLLKNSTQDELHRAVVHIAEGGVLVSPAMAATLLAALPISQEPEPQAPTNLSRREQEVLQILAQGATNKEIASQLVVSENTVKTHLRNIMDKLHVANRGQAAAMATKLHLGQQTPHSSRE